MPLLIPRDAQALWLDPKSSLEDVLNLAERPPSLEAHPVGFGVNDPKNDDETLIAPVAETARG
jgi:putative SOS response-associated peptidase YedK